MSMDKLRFYVDERLGCVAVIDDELRDLTCMRHRLRLHGEAPGVVQYWPGEIINDQWVLPNEFIIAAHELCNRLNAEHMNMSEDEFRDWLNAQSAADSEDE